MTAGILLSMIIVTIITSIYLRYRIRKKINVGYNFDDFDMIWEYRPCVICVFAAFIAGVCSGLLSIGGGIVMSPILFRLGARAEVIVPTSSVLYVLTSSMAVILFIIEGKVPLGYSIFVGISSLIGSVFGIFLIQILVKRFQRASLMVIAMTILLALCTIFVPLYGIIHYLNNPPENTPQFCSG